MTGSGGTIRKVQSVKSNNRTQTFRAKLRIELALHRLEDRCVIELGGVPSDQLALLILVCAAVQTANS